LRSSYLAKFSAFILPNLLPNRIAVRFEYEYHNQAGKWYRAYGSENWEFAENGLMMRCFASINGFAIQESDHKFCWERN
jgi:nuclear transport factor 2 (NTF2) superfamily protein